MTYCVGMLLDAGLVFLADSRTNAGVDHINTFRKMTVFERPGERVMVLLASGNLAITQALVAMLREKLSAADGAPNLWHAPNLFEATRHVGEALREVHRRDAQALAQFNIEFGASFIFGGQICGEPPRLFCVYAAGNFIEAVSETPYFQVGESKYGKPILDRVLSRAMPLGQAAKCALISMDSTLRSNLSVGLPLDLLVIRSGESRVHRHINIDSGAEYFARLRSLWGERLRQVFTELPDPDWLTD